MQDADRLDSIYTRGYCIIVMAVSALAFILLLASDFAWWQNTTTTHVRLSSTFRISILIILPLIFGFIATGVLAGMVYFVNETRKNVWKKWIFWIALSILGVTIGATGTLLIVFLKNSTSWGFGPGFMCTTLGSGIIMLSYLLYFKLQQDIRS